MAYGRRYWRRYYRRYYRGRYNNSYWKTRMTKNFKASASNMTQGGTFNVSAHKEVNLDLPAPQQGTTTSFNYDKLDIPAIIASSDMHGYLSNVFDQYRVDRLAIRIRAVGNSKNGIVNPSMLFSAVDRTDFANNLPLSTIRTYGSYRESQISGAKDISPTHTVYISQSNLVEWSTYTDTKNRVSFPCVLYGCAFANITEAITVSVSIEIDAQIRYRGVRLDTRTVNPQPLIPVSTLLIDRIKAFGVATNGTRTEVQLTKVTSNIFYLQQYDHIYAIKVTGNDAYRVVRGYKVLNGTATVEFEKDPEYEYYRGNNSANDAQLDIHFQNNDLVFTVGVCEANEGAISMDTSEWATLMKL